MKKLFLEIFLILFLTAGTSHSQVTEDWVRKFSTDQQSIQESYDAVTDVYGNVYVAGRTSLGFSGYDMVLVKYNSAGNYIWGKTFHSDSGYFSVEACYSLVQYKTGDSIFIYTSVLNQSNGRIWVIKYNQNGILIWKKSTFLTFSAATKPVMHVDASGNCYTAGGNAVNAYLLKYSPSGTMLYYTLFTNPPGYSQGTWNAITEDATGNILLTGKIDSIKTKYVTAKYNPSGVLLWSKMLKGAGNLNCSANDIAVGAGGNVYVTGEFDNGNLDYFTIKYNGTTGDTLWTRKFNGTANGSDLGRCIEVDAAENVFVTGLTNRSSNGSIATLKYNLNGVLQWTRVYSGLSALQDEPSDMVKDALGNIIIAGVSDSSSAENTLAIKYNTAGDSLWVRNYSFTSNDYERPAAIHLDNSSNVILTGYCSDPDQRDFATLKYNSAGNLQWAKRFNGAQTINDKANSITTDKKGNVYTIGKYQSNFGDNILIAKYNSAGVLKWSYQNGPALFDEGVDIKVDSNGYVYYTATLSNTFARDIYYGKLDSNGSSYYFFPIDYEFYSEPVACELDNSGNFYITGKATIAGEYCFTTIKINAGGTPLWIKEYGDAFAGTDIPKSVTVDPAGNVYVTGTSDSATTNDDIVTLKYSSAGDLQWSRRVNGSANLDDMAGNVITDKGGNAYVSGTKIQTVGGEMGVILKYNPSGTLLWTRTVNLNATTGAEAVVAIRTDTSKTKIFAAGYSIITGLLNADYTITKFDSAGTQLWQNTYGNINSYFDKCVGLAVDKNENAYITGFTYSVFHDFLTVCFGYDGSFKWSKVYEDTSGGDDIITGHNPVTVDLNGNVFIAGSSYDSLFGNMITTIKYKPQPAFTLNLIAFIEGFYDQSSNMLVSDSVKVFLRNASAPYNIIDSSKGILNTSGSGSLNFTNASNGVNYYIVAKHRNSIETWSAGANVFVSGSMSYNFSTAASSAYGNNQIQADASPLRFAIFGGDVNQDGNADLTDISLVYNSASVFAAGYVITDVTGDNISNLTDVLLTYNNSNKFIQKITP